jgi:hypothetical protein
VFSPSKPILPDVPPANAMAMIETVLGQQPAGGAVSRALPGCVPELHRVYAAFRG